MRIRGLLPSSTAGSLLRDNAAACVLAPGQNRRLAPGGVAARCSFGALAVLANLGLLACEDGPRVVGLPLSVSDPGPLPVVPVPFVAGDTRSFGDRAQDDQVGSAKFCAEAEETELAQWMVSQPLVPDVSAGGVPLWANDKPLLADDLLGERAAQKLCNPGGTYANAFTWGPTNEVIVLFDEDTHLVDAVIATQQYLGAMSGTYSDAAGAAVEVVAKPRERLAIGGQLLDVYASRAAAPSEPRSWLNPANVTNLYRMVRQTFFNSDPLPADFDCVAAQICDIIYTASNEDTPQPTVVALQDSGIQVVFTPEGYADQIVLQPVRSAPFENGGTIAFGADGAPAMSFGLQSTFRGTCALSLDTPLSFADFQRLCIASGDERALDRATYSVATVRDAVSVQFNGVSLGFLRDTTVQPLLLDGQQPAAQDGLYSVGFTRIMPAPVAEFRPLSLANAYKARLEAHLRAAVSPDPATGGIEDHPLATYALTVPFTEDAPQRIGELLLPDGRSWLPVVMSELAALYQALPPAQKARVNAEALRPVALIEPFVDAVLSAFSHGEVDAAGAVKAFRTTDDARWSIGLASFMRAGVPYRLIVEYSLNFGAVTSVTVSRGASAIDRIIDAGRPAATTPYFEASDMRGTGLVSLRSAGISVTAADRQLGTLTLGLPGDVGALQVSGSSLADLSGYLRQTRGERYEFIPSHEVNLFGKETAVVAWVREDGTIGKLENRTFKGALDLCPGLPIRYGDNVEQRLLAWERTVAATTYRACDLVFNYSENGNVLGEVASLATRTAFAVVDGRAITVSVWE